MAGSVDGVGAAARFRQPTGITIDASGNVFVADTLNQTIRSITPAGVVSTLAGTAGTAGSTDGTPGNAKFNFPEGMASGSLYVADTASSTIRKITTPGFMVTTLAGNAGFFGSADCPSPGNCQRIGIFAAPRSLGTDSFGNVYVADTGNNTIRKITPTGVVTTLAGRADTPPGSADGTGTVARFNNPAGMAVDGSGNLYVADTFNHTIRKVTTPAGVVTTLAGTAGQSGSTDGTGAAARFNFPTGMAVDARSENLYVVDTFNHAIRRITLPAGVVSTFAGTPGTAGSANGPGASAQFTLPGGVAVDRTGNVYVADSFNNTIRKLDPLPP